MFFRCVYIIESMLIILLGTLIFSSCQRYQYCFQLGQVFVDEREQIGKTEDFSVNLFGAKFYAIKFLHISSGVAPSSIEKCYFPIEEHKKNSGDEKVSCKSLIHKRAINIIEKNVGLVLLFFIMGFYIRAHNILQKIGVD